MANDYTPLFSEEAPDLEKDENLEWLRKRLGHFTGSSISDLMSCDRSMSKKPWTDATKVYGVGNAFIKYVFRVAMERKTGAMNHETSSFTLRHGKENEPLVIEQLIKDGVIETHDECDFITYQDLYLGATPDGKVLINGKIYALEIKSCVSWDGYFDRKSKPVSETHKDFWQIQTEMMVLNVNKCLYVVTLPMEYEKYEHVIVEASEIHRKRLIERYELAEKCITNWDPSTEDIADSIKETIKKEIEKCIDLAKAANEDSKE